MKAPRARLKRFLLIFFIILFVLLSVVIAVISPVAKYMVEKYDVKYLGREVKIGWAYLNPVTGFIRLRDVRIYEQGNNPWNMKEDSVFFSSKGITVNVTLRKLFSKTIEISKLTLDSPLGVIIQDSSIFNFSDIIKKFTHEKQDTGDPLKISILNIRVNDGEFHFNEKGTPINYYLKDVYFDSKGKKWDSDTIAGVLSLKPGIGTGDVKADFALNIKNKDYRMDLQVKKLDFTLLDQYLRDLANYGNIRGTIDAGFKATGNLTDPGKTTNTGRLVISDFHFGMNPKTDYVSFEKLVIAIRKMSPDKRIYNYDSITVTRPVIIYERYQHLDNLQRMFGKKGSNISKARADPEEFNLILTIADYIRDLTRNFFKSNFRIDRLAVYHGKFKFHDYSLTEKFAMESNDFNFAADSIDREKERVLFSVNTTFHPFGDMSVKLSINPRDSGDFILHYNFQNFPLAMFNPYLVSYTSYPLDGGTIEVKGDWYVLNSKINSRNHLLVIDPKVSLRVRNKDTKWVPTPILMALIREQGNVIDYEIPITGNLKDPKFHLKDMITDILGNIFIKPARIPYISKVKELETEIQKSLALQWGMRRTDLLPNHERFVEKMAQFLAKNPEAEIEVQPVYYADKEKEYVLFFEAKKKYFLSTKDKTSKLSTEDSLMIDKMSVNDSAFVRYINKQVRDAMVFTMQEKCRRYVGTAIVNDKFGQMNKQREEAFLSAFKKKKVEKRLHILAGKTEIPYNGFSYYKIDYKGDFPEDLAKAYQEMNELNKEAPRKRFQKEREKTRRGIFR